MQIRTNRIYPYPVLSEMSDDFKDNTFTVERTLEYDATKAIINLKTTISDTAMLNLIKNGKASLNCNIECSTTKYRKLFLVPNDRINDYDIEIPLPLLNGNIEIVCVIVANEEIIFESDNLNDLYSDEIVTYPKYATIGYTDTEEIRIIKNMNINGDVPSIFSISMAEHDDKISYDCSNDIITIFLPKKEHEIYIDSKGKYKRLKQLMVNVAVLASIIDEIKENSDSYESNGWYKVLEEKYQSLGYENMLSSNFKSEQSLKLAQMVLGNISKDAFNEFDKLRVGEDE